MSSRPVFSTFRLPINWRRKTVVLLLGDHSVLHNKLTASSWDLGLSSAVSIHRLGHSRPALRPRIAVKCHIIAICVSVSAPMASTAAGLIVRLIVSLRRSIQLMPFHWCCDCHLVYWAVVLMALVLVAPLGGHSSFEYVCLFLLLLLLLKKTDTLTLTMNIFVWFHRFEKTTACIAIV